MTRWRTGCRRCRCRPGARVGCKAPERCSRSGNGRCFRTRHSGCRRCCKSCAARRTAARSRSERPRRAVRRSCLKRSLQRRCSARAARGGSRLWRRTVRPRGSRWYPASRRHTARQSRARCTARKHRRRRRRSKLHPRTPGPRRTAPLPSRRGRLVAAGSRYLLPFGLVDKCSCRSPRRPCLRRRSRASSSASRRRRRFGKRHR